MQSAQKDPNPDPEGDLAPGFGGLSALLFIWEWVWAPILWQKRINGKETEAGGKGMWY